MHPAPNKDMNRRREVLAKFTVFFVIVMLGAMVTASAQAQFSGIDVQKLLTDPALQKALGEATVNTEPQSIEPMVDKAREVKEPESEKLLEGEKPVEETASLPSAIELDYQQRFDTSLLQFGYDSFEKLRPEKPAFIGTVTDNYILGIGDELVLTYRGQKSDSFIVRVDREGNITLPDIEPVPAAGSSLGDFRDRLRNLIKRAIPGTEVYISIGKVRTANIYVIGEVNNPGIKQLTSFSSVLDALALAGGVKKTGSLRQVRLIRGAETHTIDLYDLFLGLGDSGFVTLNDGDRLIVPTIGGTIALAGDVKRPGIYELLDAEEVTIAAALDFAGGAMRRLGNRYLRQGLTKKGEDIVKNISDIESTFVREQDIIIVQRENRSEQNVVYLDGHVRSPGRRSLSNTGTVGDLIQSTKQLQDHPYLLFAIIERRNLETGNNVYLPFNLQAVLDGTTDVPLNDEDTVIILSRDDVRYLWSADIKSLLVGALPALLQLADTPENPEDKPENPGGIDTKSTLFSKNAENQIVQQVVSCRGLTHLHYVMRSKELQRFTNVARSIIALDADKRDTLDTFTNCPAIYDMYAEILPLALEHVVAVTGEVRVPGAYPVGDTATLEGIITSAGGFTRMANQQDVELSQFLVDATHTATRIQRITVNYDGTTRLTPVNAGDFVKINAKSTDAALGVVTIGGEVRNPGVYEIRRDERLSSLIERAGGLTTESYAYGTVFTRASVRQVEQESFRRVADELQTSIFANITRLKDVGPGGAAILTQYVQDLVKQLQTAKAVGRMVVQADPDVLIANPDEDILLEPQDSIFVPKRPAYIMVSGDVLNQGAQKYDADKTARDYIRAAGNFRTTADEDKVFVILPNGQTQPLSISYWNFTPTQIPPGSTIVVPRDPIPIDLLTASTEILSVIQQLAVSTAALAVISRE